MTVFHTQAAALATLDATPQGRVTAGHGVGGVLKSVDAWATPTASAGIDTTISMVRIPFSAIVKEIVFMDPDGQDTSGKFDIGVYYATDGSNALSVAGTAADPLLAADAIDQDFFTVLELDSGAQAQFARLVPGGGLRVTNATPAVDHNTVWEESDAHKPLWEALGLSADPGGNAEIVVTVVEAPGAATTPIYVRVDYI